MWSHELTGTDKALVNHILDVFACDIRPSPTGTAQTSHSDREDPLLLGFLLR